MKPNFHWREYLMEAWALGMFMVSACAFTILFEHPVSPFRQAIPSAFVRRAIEGAAMGLTAIGLIYSPWGKRSGAHMNPAVTLTNWQLNRITGTDTLFYILAQFAGGTLGVMLFRLWLPDYMDHPAVNFVATVPGNRGVMAAFVAETFISLLLISTVLHLSNHKTWAPYTGYAAGVLVALFITFEAPLSGMSMNPARTFGSAFEGHIWTDWWIYFTAPLLGMLGGGYLFRWQHRRDHDGDCSGIRCHMSGQKHGNRVYDVFFYPEIKQN